jgi:hypothetical protein
VKGGGDAGGNKKSMHRGKVCAGSGRAKRVNGSAGGSERSERGCIKRIFNF